MAKGRGRSGRRRAVAEINVVPYIDVMLVLLIIFMVTAPMLQQGIEVDTPKVASKTMSSKGEPPVLVSIDKDGLLYLSILENPKVPRDADSIKAEVAAYHKRKPDVPVMVEGYKDLPYKKVVEVMKLVSDAGVEKVGLVTENPTTDKASVK